MLSPSLAICANCDHNAQGHGYRAPSASLMRGIATWRMVLFDWALASYGAPDTVISNVVWSRLLEFNLDMQQAEQLEAAIFESYLHGSAGAGWLADPRLVCCAELISAEPRGASG